VRSTEQRLSPLALGMVTALLASAAAVEARADALTFRRVAGGIEHAAFRLGPSGALPLPVTGHVFVVDLRRVEARVISAAAGSTGAGRREVSVLVAGLPWHLAINASFFDTDGRAMGRVVDRGQTRVASRQAGWGALVIQGQKARVVRGQRLPALGGGGDLVVQGVPRLLVGGVAFRFKPAVARRTAVCAEGSRLVVVVSSAATLEDLARWLATPTAEGGPGCASALNLDGGPSTQLSVRLPGLTLQVGGADVPNALVLIPR
jgi:hypothetical protein